MNITTIVRRTKTFLSVAGPATITAMADNDAAGVATYAVAGAVLGYPILLVLLLITPILGLTQEMGMRLSLVTRKGLGDVIREYYGIKASMFVFICLLIANMGTIIVDVAAFKTTGELLQLPAIPITAILIFATFVIVTKGNYKLTQNIMLLSSLFYLSYVISAFHAHPDWGMAVSNLIFPHGIQFTGEYWRTYVIIGLGVLGTTITPWGQFFISSFELDKKIDISRIKYARLETYGGAFFTDFFSFFMIVATAATLFVHGIPLTSGTQAALAIKPFAGELAGVLFAWGIMNAGFMGIVTVGLSTTYAFTEFFGLSGGLDTSFTQSKTFYVLFLTQLLVAFGICLLPFISLFHIAVASQVVNAIILVPIFWFLIKFTSDKSRMGSYVNNPLQKWAAVVSTVVIGLASVFAIMATIFHG
jgi:Mn2+/Fe2+ NRAMP family transporter